MPPKRSKSKERERKRKQRAKMSEDEKELEREKLKTRMGNLRASSSDERRELEKIEQKHKKRNSREKRSGKEKLLENFKAKRGMQQLNEEGRMTKFKRRGKKNITKDKDYEFFIQKGKKEFDLLEGEQPDIVERINKKFREQKEKERAHEEKYGNYYFDGEDYVPQDFDETEITEDNFDTITKEEMESLQKQKREMEDEWARNKKKIQKENNQENQKQLKLALLTPLPPIPQRELCDYEKIRENNIRERMEAMAESGFFEDLADTKKEIGLGQLKKE